MNSTRPVYPDQLNISIRTSIPGFQLVDYSPSMTIPESTDKVVQFNPLVKLKTSVIQKIPEEYRVKEFFNKGWFQSLLNLTGEVPLRDLAQATRYGYVDHNIKVTLNTLFPTGSVIHIGGKPYAIGDVQWSTGNWKVNIKQQPVEIDPSKVTDPTLYTQLVKQEILTGEQQLKQLSPVSLAGANYTSAQPNPNPEPKIQTIVEEPKPAPRVETAVALPTHTKPLPPLAIEPTPPTASQPLAIEPAPDTQPLLLPAPEPEEKEEKIEEMSIDEHNLFNTFKDGLETSVQSTRLFRKYFQTDAYRNVVKLLYSKFSPVIKTNIRKFYFATTNFDPPVKSIALNNTSYNKLCDQVTVLSSPSDGDCFFKAVADGINIYNYENQGSKLLYAIYGKTKLFTANVLREVVYRYIVSLPDIQDLFVVAEEQVADLNRQFKESLNELKRALRVADLDPSQYASEINNVYHRQPNFLIYKPYVVPIDVHEYERPFRVIKRGELERYIKSKDYWANDVAIEAVCSLLKLCVIPIEHYTVDKSDRVKPVSVARLRALLTNNEMMRDQCAHRVMYLLHKQNHYELIRFSYITKPLVKPIGEGLRNKIDYTAKWYSIFSSNELSPPIHILVLLYGSIYAPLQASSQHQFSLYRPIMKYIHNAVSAILFTPEKDMFAKWFNDLFPSNANRIRSDSATTSTSTTDTPPSSPLSPLRIESGSMIGGLPVANSLTKDRNASKITYSITIDMEVHPGTTLSPAQLSQSKCNTKYNAIRKAFAEFTGRPYIIPPVYHATSTAKNTSVRGGQRRTRKRRL